MARAACAVYGLLLLYSGLAPWSGWRDLGIDAFAYLSAPVPHYITHFDLGVNVIAYVPFGALLALAFYPQIRGFLAIALAALAGLLLSGAIEAAQTFLPSRIPSNLDLLTNALGSVAGAVIAAPYAATLIDRGRLVEWRHRWFERQTTAALIALALWPAAQIFPEPMLFGNGDMRSSLGPLVNALGGQWWQFDAEQFGPAEFVLGEAFVVASSLLAVGLALCSVLRRNSPRYRVLIALVLASLAAKSVGNAVQFGPERALAWLTPGAFGGIALAVLSLAVAPGLGRAGGTAAGGQHDSGEPVLPGSAAGVAARSAAELQRVGRLAVYALAARPRRRTGDAACGERLSPRGAAPYNQCFVAVAHEPLQAPRLFLPE
jgi:VanZ family protein